MNAAAKSARRVPIIWKEAEWALVIDAARRLGPPERGDSHEVWQRMQEVLPAQRRRHGFDPSNMAMINKERAKGRPHGPAPKAAAQPEVVTVAPPLSVVSEHASVAVARAPLAEQVAGSASEIIAGSIKEALLRVLYDPDLRAAAKDLIKEVLAPESKEQVASGVLWRPKVAGREDLKRVVVAAGGKAALQAPVELRPLARFYDIRVWDSRNENSARLRALLQNADAAVVRTGTVSHGGSDTIKAWSYKVPGAKVVYYDRNWAQLVDDLPQLLGDSITIQSGA